MPLAKTKNQGTQTCHGHKLYVKRTKITTIRGYKTHVNLKPVTQPYSPAMHAKLGKASQVVLERKKTGHLRLCADYKTKLNGKIIDEEY